MEISYKTQAAIQFLAPTAILYTLYGAYLINQDWPSLSLIEKNSAGLAVMAIAAMLAQDLVPKPIKEWIVFWRIKERLPGHRAFTSRFMKNPEIDKDHIDNFEELSIASAETQQRHFLRLYKKVSEKKSITHYSQRYIAWRDLSSLLLILIFVTIPVLSSFESNRAVEAGVTLTGTALAALCLTIIAARNSANALVTQVLMNQRQEQESG